MKDKNKVSTKLSREGIEFFKRFCTNRRKADTDKRDLSYWKLLEVISDYLKTDNETYLKLVKSPWRSKNA